FLSACICITKAEESPQIMKFKVKRHHIKSQKTLWDGKAAIAEAVGDVVITLWLDDGTTAYVNCDKAKDYRAAGRLEAMGNVHVIWNDITIDSDHADWDMGKREARFRGNGALHDSDFAGGDIVLAYERLDAKVSATNFTTADAWPAKGIWKPKAATK
ncbi:MAG: hypothetical protein AABZ44_04300, partial [Elusimicrobiota bacterium]